MDVKTLLITQARTGSTRLPGKVLKTVNARTLLQIHLDRLKKSKLVDAIIVATTTAEPDAVIYQKAIDWGYAAFRGSETDVLDRYYQAATPYKPSWVVRVTSDCPLLDASLLDDVIYETQKRDVDYGANVIVERYPDGQDVEVFKFSALEKAWKETHESFNREHVTPYIRNNSDMRGGNLFRSFNYPCDENFSKIRMTVDEERDFQLIERLLLNLGENRTWREYTLYMIEQGLTSLNDGILRNEALVKYLNSTK